MILNVSVAAATAVVGYDLFSNERNRVASTNRIVSGMALTGSTAADDTIVDLYVGSTYVGQFLNTATGEIDVSRDLVAISPILCRAGDQISCIVRDAPAANPINCRVY